MQHGCHDPEGAACRNRGAIVCRIGDTCFDRRDDEPDHMRDVPTTKWMRSKPHAAPTGRPDCDRGSGAEPLRTILDRAVPDKPTPSGIKERRFARV